MHRGLYHIGHNHIGHKPHRTQPHRPQEKTILATMNNHVGLLVTGKCSCYLASTFKSYPFETQNIVCNPVSHKWRVKKLFERKLAQLPPLAIRVSGDLQTVGFKKSECYYIFCTNYTTMAFYSPCR